MKSFRVFTVFATAIILNTGPIYTAAEEPNGSAEIPEPTRFISGHSNRFNDSRIDYQAISGETYVRDIEGEPKASIFSFAYIKTNLEEGEVRPVTFIWNGGPGSASIWLHMGSYGPKRIVVPVSYTHLTLPTKRIV